LAKGKPGIVAVDGSTGYLGTHLVSRLLEMGLPVRAVVHGRAKEQDVQFLKDLGADVRVATMTDSDDSLDLALTGVGVVVHLIGSIAPKKGERLEDLHVNQTACLVEAAKRCAVSKIVMVTALGSAPDAVSEYHRTKFRAEEKVRSGGRPFVILRPSLIFGRVLGRRDSKLIARYIHLIRTRAQVPLIGGGNNKLQPVFISDLVTALVQSIASDEFVGQTLEIGGADVVTMREIVETLMQTLNEKKKVSALPPPLAQVVAMVCETVQNVPTISRDQVRLSQTDNVCSVNALTSKFQIKPVSLRDGLRTYVGSAGSEDGTLVQDDQCTSVTP
jgi:NADH dehydrogenase